jgi:hypothetical protein
MTPQQTRQRKPGRARRAIIAGAVALTLSAGGATAWALDRFVVQHVEIADVSAYEASQAGSSPGSSAGTSTGTAAGTASGSGGAAVTTDTSYVSDSSTINISTVSTGSGDNTVTYYVADVVLEDATTLQSAFANDSFGENITETTSALPRPTTQFSPSTATITGSGTPAS